MKLTSFAKPAAGNSDLSGQAQYEELGEELHIEVQLFKYCVGLNLSSFGIDRRKYEGRKKRREGGENKSTK